MLRLRQGCYQSSEKRIGLGGPAPAHSPFFNPFATIAPLAKAQWIL